MNQIASFSQFINEESIEFNNLMRLLNSNDDNNIDLAFHILSSNILNINDELKEKILNYPFKCAEHFIFNDKFISLNINKHVKETIYRTIPSHISNFINLEWLDLNFANITSLPKSITKLSKLRYFDFGGNKIKIIPKNIGNLSELIYLNTGLSNKMNKIPESIGNLNKLRVLILGNGIYPELPSSMLNLGNLEYLAFHCRGLLEFPQWIVNLKNLKILDLGNGGNEIIEKHDLYEIQKSLPNTIVLYNSTKVSNGEYFVYTISNLLNKYIPEYRLFRSSNIIRI